MNDLKMLNEIEPMFLCTDEKGNDIYVFKCQRKGCNNFYTAKEKSRATSCGCLIIENARKMGIRQKKHNIIQHTSRGYSRVYFNNLDDSEDFNFFIVDNKNCKDFDTNVQPKPLNATADRRTNSGDIEPCITINGKKIRYPNYLMKTDTANGQQIDHLNHQTLDCRECNIRIGTRLQNLANTKRGIGCVIRLKNGKYGISFPEELKIDTSKYEFDSKDEAKIILKQIISQDERFKDWVYENSQKIAQRIETYEFIKDKWVDSWAKTGTMGEIMRLSPASIQNARLHDLKVQIKSGEIYPDQEWMIVHDLMYDYNQSLK